MIGFEKVFGKCKNDTYQKRIMTTKIDFYDAYLKRLGHKCFVGDFNWLSWTSPHKEDSKEMKFIEAVGDCYLHQHLEKPTCKRGNDEPLPTLIKVATLIRLN